MNTDERGVEGKAVISVDQRSSAAELVSSQPIRVLHLNAGNLYGGVETVLVALARFRDLCPAMQPSFGICREGRLSDELAQAGVPVHRLGEVRLSRPWTLFAARRRLRTLLLRESFDVVVCHMPWSLVTFGPAVRSAGTGLAFWAHGFHAGRHWLERIARRVTPDLAIANSEYVRASVGNLFAALPAQTFRYPVELPDLRTAAQSRGEIRREFGVPDGTVVIIQVSRLDIWKGHRIHLEALSRLTSKNWMCWMVGGPQRPEESQYLRELQQTATLLGIGDRVRFLGQRTDVGHLLAGADVFCQPNQSPEPFGIVFVEAMWRGLPVVTSNIGGVAEFVDASCGLLTDPGNMAGIASSLEQLIESEELRKRLGRNGSVRARQVCDPQIQIPKLHDLLAGAARTGGRA
jgi:glycosyltransferase involved in cell wall biosynthesis